MSSTLLHVDIYTYIQPVSSAHCPYADQTFRDCFRSLNTSPNVLATEKIVALVWTVHMWTGLLATVFH